MAMFSEQNDANARLSADDVVTLSRQIALLASSGLPLGPGLRATAEELAGGNLKSTLLRLADSIDEGQPIDKALAAQGDRLPGYFQGIVLAGVKTGKLSEVLGQFVTLTNSGVEIRRKLWLSLLYPLTALVIALSILIFVCAGLVTSFATIFRDFGVALPSLTIMLIGFSEFLVAKGSLLLVLLVMVVGLGLTYRLVLPSSVRNGLISQVPILGNLSKWTALAEFCHLLGVMLDCRIPLSTAIGLAGSGVGNGGIDRACVGMKTDVEQGMSLSDAVRRQNFFPKGVARILKWAEGHQGLPESLHMTGKIFEERASIQCRFMGNLLKILAIVMILLGVMTVVLALFVPMINLIGRLSG